MSSSTIYLIIILVNAGILAFMLYWFRRKDIINIPKMSRMFKEEEGRYYFYQKRCSFALPQNEIKSCDIQKNGLKHVLMTESMLMVILEKRDGMPNFPPGIPLKGDKIGDVFCLAAKVNPIFPDYNQFFYDCGSFVIQASITLPTEKTNQFIHSFRLEK